jgi:hypothetical protein
MRKILLTLGLFIGIVCNAQTSFDYVLQDTSGAIIMVGDSVLVWADATPTPTGYSDDFEDYTTGTLNGQGDWVILHDVVNVVDVSGDNQVGSTGTGQTALAYYDDDFDDDQSSQVDVHNILGNGYAGVGVRLSGTSSTRNGYIYYGSDTWKRLRKYVNGSSTDLTYYTSGGLSDDDEVRIEVEGTTISCYLNGVLDTDIGTGGETEDSDLTTGKGGIAVYYNGRIDDWEGKDL